MKIKLPLSGEVKPPSDGKVSPVVEPTAPTMAPGAPAPTRGRKGCTRTWNCCDFTLLGFIVAIGLLVVVGVGMHVMVEHKITEWEEHHYDSDFEDYRQHAECKVVSVVDNGMRECNRCGNGGIKDDQLEHGWWDWMEKEDGEEDEDKTGWQEDGFFRHEPLEDMEEGKPEPKPEEMTEEERKEWEMKKEEEYEKKEETEERRVRRGFNKGWHYKKSSFPCVEIIVEVDPKGNKFWEEDDSSEEWSDEDSHEHRRRKEEHEEMEDEHEREKRHDHGDGSHEDDRHMRRKKCYPHRPPYERGMDDEPVEEPEPEHMEPGMAGLMAKEKEWEMKMKDMIERGVHHATLYDSYTTAENHRQCSVSICKSVTERNKKCVYNYVGEYKKMWAKEHKFPCYFYEEEPQQVFELEPEPPKEAGRYNHYHARKYKMVKAGVIGIFFLWGALILAFGIRRCMQCKVTSRANRPHQYATNTPQVVTVDAPVSEMSEKEKEALGEAPVTPRSVWTVDDAPSAPPAYVTLDTKDVTDALKAEMKAWAIENDAQMEKADKAASDA